MCTHAILCIADYGIEWTWSVSDNTVTAYSLIAVFFVDHYG